MTTPNNPAKRKHKATYAADKKKGGWMIRVQGPNAGAFAGKEVPVTMRNESEHTEKLDRLVWSGIDDETKQPVSLYTFVPKPKTPEEEPSF